jgi:hypothetical protein
MKTIDQDYDEKIRVVLERRLNRPAKPNEILNADTDTDLVSETMWEILKEQNERISLLESKSK